MDIWPPEKRSEVMARIRGKDTKPELIVRLDIPCLDILPNSLSVSYKPKKYTPVELRWRA